MNDVVHYLEEIRGTRPALIREMEEEAKRDHVPIMDALGFETYRALLQLQRPKRLLEIGTAIGYSAIRMASAVPSLEIVSIERNEHRYERATYYVERSEYKDRITLIHADALSEEMTFQPNTFDALFIDAAKGQYRNFFEKYVPYLKEDGVVYCDNLFMHGLVFQKLEEVPRRNRTMYRNLRDFTKWLHEHPAYDFSILPVGDGIGIARKKDR